MADKQSREGKKIVRTGQTDHGQYYVEYEDGTREAAISAHDLPEDNNGIGGIKVKLDLSDNIKQLKAIQREARKATVALKELEEQQKKISDENTP